MPNEHNVILSCYIILFLLLLYLIVSLNHNSNGLFGYSARIVITGSMEPAIKTNSVNIIKNCSINDIKTGDIVCFKYGQDIIHRVIDKTTNDNGDVILYTKGDANEKADSIEVNEDMVVGKVVKSINWISGIIEKYSIAPGVIDSVSLSKNIILCVMAIFILGSILVWIVEVIVNLIKVTYNEKTYDEVIDTYNECIKELQIYNRTLRKLKKTSLPFDCTAKNEAKICNKIAKAKIAKNIAELKGFTEHFNKAMSNNEKINNLWRISYEQDKKERNFVLFDLKNEGNKDNL